MKRHHTIGCVSLSLCLFVFGIDPQQCHAADEKLTNASIIELQSLSLGDGVIIEKIKTSKCDFDTSIDALKKLKDAKISSAVIQAMIAASAPAPASATPAPLGDPNDPAAPHAAGAWAFVETNGTKTLVQLQSETPSGQTSGGGGAWAMGWGASAKTQVIIKGTKSETLLSGSKPVFYFYIGQAAATVNRGESAAEFVGVQNPKEIVLAKLTRKTDKGHDERLLTTGTYNAYAGSSFGVDPKATRVFDSEKIADGIYKITLKDDLNEGEYAFCAAMSQGHGRFFTFGVQVPPSP